MIAVILAMLLQVIYPFQCLDIGLDDIEARDIWVGYENGGFDLPDDLEYVLPYRDDEYQIWFRYSPSKEEYYVFPFDHVPTMENPHPCAGAAITPDDYIEVVNALYDN
jgi:hypothetical protein